MLRLPFLFLPLCLGLAIAAEETPAGIAAGTQGSAPASVHPDPAPAMDPVTAAPDLSVGTALWAFRLGWLRLPVAQKTELTVKDQGSWTAYDEQTGDVDEHWRVDASLMRLWRHEPVSFAVTMGPTYGELQASNDLGAVRHRFFGLGAEALMVVRPDQMLSLEAGVGVHAAYAMGDMLVQRNGGPVQRLTSDYGFAYDVAIRLRPVYRPVPWCEAFLTLDYTLFLEERLAYAQDGLDVLEVDTMRGPGFGLGLGMRF